MNDEVNLHYNRGLTPYDSSPEDIEADEDGITVDGYTISWEWIMAARAKLITQGRIK